MAVITPIVEKALVALDIAERAVMALGLNDCESGMRQTALTRIATARSLVSRGAQYVQCAHIPTLSGTDREDWHCSCGAFEFKREISSEWSTRK